MKRQNIFICFLMIIILIPSVLQSVSFQGVTKQEVIKENKEESKEVQVGPQDIQEKTSVYFFLGWMWFSIGILVYFLRMKIKELDRLTSYGYQAGQGGIDDKE